MEPTTRLPFLGEDAPAFKAFSTQGEINFPMDYRGKRVVFFSHPADFTALCATELLEFQKKIQDFKNLNTELLGYSVDSVYAHIAWIKDMKNVFGIEITFPLLAGLDIANKYGLIHPDENADTTTRSLFIINPQGKIKAVLSYPKGTGRNVDEVIRIIKSLQINTNLKRVTPANRPNNSLLQDKLIIPSANNLELSDSNEHSFAGDTRYLRSEPLGEDVI